MELFLTSAWEVFCKRGSKISTEFLSESFRYFERQTKDVSDCELNNLTICILSSFVLKGVVSVHSIKLINSRPLILKFKL